MNLYPAMSAQMGRWDYYLVKMNMREVAESVKFAHDIYEDQTLDEAIQRSLNEPRVKTKIVTYLQRQQDRFFASIVVAALGGNPKWYPVLIEGDPRFEVLAADERLNKSFGVLAFDGSQEYYALDGQHRLAAIKTLIDPTNPEALYAPDGFRDEEISVLVVVPKEAELPDEFLQRYRRLFGNLNRYAKPMDLVTSIIMDEDDAFAIVTRRLISSHEFLMAPGRQRESARVKTEKGKNLKTNDPYFTSLETLYAMNISLLNARYRGYRWGAEGWDRKGFQMIRPDDEYLDALFNELVMYWNALLEVLPVLRSDPVTMRIHDLQGDEEGGSDHLLFWPIGQMLLADVARDMLDHRLDDVENPSPESVRAALAGLGSIEWRLHEPPWRFFLLTQKPGGGWKMRDEDRAKTLDWGKILVEWLLGVYEPDEAGAEDLFNQWASRLSPAQAPEDVTAMWDEVTAARRSLLHG